MKTTITNLRLCLILIILCSFTLTSAHDFEVDGIYYNINGNEATVTFKGTSYYSFSNEYSGYVTIPTTVTNDRTIYSVTAISEYAFYGCTELTGVTIPSSMASIGARAFSGCSSLTDVYSSIADPSVISMGEKVFYLYNEHYSNRKLHVPLGSIPVYQNDQKWRTYFATIEDGETMVTVGLKGELQIAEGGNEVQGIETSISYDQLWISYTGDEDVEFTILFDTSFDMEPGGGGFQKRDGERDSYYLLNGDDISEYVTWDSINKRYIVDLYSLVLDDDVFNDFDSFDLDYYDIYFYFTFRITVHADGYNDLSKEYSGHSTHYHNDQEGGFPPEISSSVSSDLSTFITVSYECSNHYSRISSPYNYISFSDDSSEKFFYGFDIYACERKDEDYYVTVYAKQHSAPEGIYWGETSKTILIPAKDGTSITISRFLDNEPLSNYYFCDGEEYSDWIIINPDFDVIGEKESLAVVEFSQWSSPFGCIWENSDNYFWKVDCQISIDGQTVSEYFYEYFYDLIYDNPVCVVDLLPYGNAFGGNHQIKVTATDGYNSLLVDTVLSYHPIDTILTPYSLVIDVNSGMGGCSLFVDDEEVELSNDGPGTPAHVYALPRKDHDYSITVQVGNFIETDNYEKDDEFYLRYQGRCQETTIVVPAKVIFDFEEDGVYYSITSENEVIVAHSEDAYQGVVTIPETVTYDGVTYSVNGVAAGAFNNDTLQSLVLPLSITSIEDGAFDGCHINSLVITGDGDWTAGAINAEVDNLYVMSGVTGIQGLQINPEMTVYSYSTIPPTCDEHTFTGYDAELHVPASALAAYFTSPYWSNFINIVGDAIEPTDLTISNDSVEVLVGKQLMLTAMPVPDNATPNAAIWTSGDESIATVTYGMITAVKAGECDIKAYLLDKVATCHVTVTEIAPTEVTLNQEFAKLEIGSQMTLTATVSPDNATDKDITWSTTNSEVATVDNAGTVTAVGQGECFITATCRDKQAMCHVIVVDHFIYITLDDHFLNITPNQLVTLTPTVNPSNTTLVVTSSNPQVAAARMANGKIQVVGITEGTTVITVNSTDGYAEADSCLVKVYTLRGDVNCDGFVNIADVTTLINYLIIGEASPFNAENADTNNDGNINIADVTRLINHMLTGEELDPKDEAEDDSETFTVNGVTFTMIKVEGGTFSMGCTTEMDSNALSDEMPVHQVTLSSYYMGQTEVTQELWEAVMGSNPSHFNTDPNCPVENVSWNQCQEFIAQLNALTAKSFRLPTEAEWEYAARGGKRSNGYTYAGSNDIDEVGWYKDNSGESTHPVGMKKANELGLFDMTGNVCEWCFDRYGYYTEAAQTNPTGPETGSSKTYRGGSWQRLATNCRIARRNYFAPSSVRTYMGLRLVL